MAGDRHAHRIERAQKFETQPGDSRLVPISGGVNLALRLGR